MVPADFTALRLQVTIQRGLWLLWFGVNASYLKALDPLGRLLFESLLKRVRDPKPLKATQNTMILHTFEVQVQVVSPGPRAHG